MRTINNKLVLIILLGSLVINIKAQDSDRTLLRQVAKDNQDAIDAIALYPTETRKTIFVAAEYPEMIAKLSAIQKISQASFEKLLSPLVKEDQEKFWNLTRYDGLLSDLATNPYKSDDETNKILVNYPEEIRKSALEKQKNNYNLIVQLDKMHKSYNSDFESLLGGYSPEAINAFKEIIKIPEVLSILFDHMQYTVVIGNYYKKNPDRVIHKTDSLNLVLTQKNAQDANDWKQSMNDDPEVQKEFTQAAQEYAQDNGYQPGDYNAPLTQDVTNYSSDPYNWWFGYPSWYPDNSWNPYPYWYDWGFYYGAGRKVVFFGLPSTYFMEWYFNNPEHFSRYAELSNHYYNYYDKHREAINYNSISHYVNDWRNRNKDIVTEDWDKDNTGRIKRFKEYGKMENKRQEYNTKHPQQQLKQSEFIQKSSSRYPLLSSDVTKNQVVLKNNTKTPVQQNAPASIKRPIVQTPNQYKVVQKPVNISSKPNLNNSRQPSVTTNTPARNPSTSKPSYNSNQVRNAQQYHQNTWNQIQSQPARQQETRQVQQSVRQQEPQQVQQPARRR